MQTDATTQHTLTLENRENLSITGVLDVDTFDDEKIILLTEEDTMMIEGEQLHIHKLDIANGELVIEGTICAITYTNGGKASASQKGFFKKILK